jgi:hypothetical protein
MVITKFPRKLLAKPCRGSRNRIAGMNDGQKTFAVLSFVGVVSCDFVDR